MYGTSPLIGSPERLFDLLSAASRSHPVAGNKDGSYLTMTSTSGLVFGVVNVVGNLGTVCVDQCYWQRAIAADGRCTVRAYLLGGLCWFSIPFFLATVRGMAADGRLV